jgi:hypothetical protein
MAYTLNPALRPSRALHPSSWLIGPCLAERSLDRREDPPKGKTVGIEGTRGPQTILEGSDATTNLADSDEDATLAIPPGNAWLVRLTWHEPTGEEMDEAGW